MADPSARAPITLVPIGVIRSPFRERSGTPIQPVYGRDALGTVVLDPPYGPALADVDGFEHLWLIYHLDRAGPWRPRVVPFRDVEERGLFATRAPTRPNPVGLSLVRLRRVDGPRLEVEGIDVLDGTPLLDIKPYVPEFDAQPGSRAGWFDARRDERQRADDRFDPP